ncbi:hypothetical protein [Enterovibrio norvegicus]|uniref:hypothetical protein n=1 Tax=Enterovibrio norvegicus TaxID=188144 RepID=UPI0024B16004|nr:hypothetical protein [Enterovibrio norvegicus]
MIKFLKKLFQPEDSSLYGKLNKQLDVVEMNRSNVSVHFLDEIKSLELALLDTLGCRGTIKVDSYSVNYEIRPVYISSNFTGFDRPVFDLYSDFTKIYIKVFFNSTKIIITSKVFLSKGKLRFKLDSDNDELYLVNDFVDKIVEKLSNEVSLKINESPRLS